MMDMEDMKSFEPEDLDWHFLFSIVSDTEHYFADMQVFQHSVQICNITCQIHPFYLPSLIKFVFKVGHG